MSLWAGIKYSLNSKLGTNNHEPLDVFFNRKTYESFSNNLILQHVLNGNSAIEIYVIPWGTTEYLPDAFNSDRSGLAKIFLIPSTITNLGDKPFAVHYNIIRFCVDSDNQYYKSDTKGALYSTIDKTLLKFPPASTENAYTVLQGTQTIGGWAFLGCSLQHIYLNESLTTIGERSFSVCKKLVEIEIPSSVKEIGASSFEGCADLREVKINDGVKTIGEYAFADCSSLESIEYGSIIENWEAISKGSGWYRNSPLKTIVCTNGVINIQSE